MNDLTILTEISKRLNLAADEATVILTKAMAGGECDSLTSKQWFEKRFLPNIIFITETGYTAMCADALKILQTTAPTDYGSSRQRDLAQLWADMTRGYLGEWAFKQFLFEKYKIESELGHETGDLQNFLPVDIHQITKPGNPPRKPRCDISIKTTKWNGIWFDIPGTQFSHSDIHILVKVGTGREHLFAFFKSISVFKDKILKKAVDVGAFTQEIADSVYAGLPSFRPIPAYICGFALSRNTYNTLQYEGKKGRKNFTINKWNGPINSGDLDLIKNKENIQGLIKFEGIGEFSHENGYLFNTGNLKWQPHEWEEMIKEL
jgi:hypothetical protein